MNTVYASYLIPESRFESLTKAVNKLARRVKSGKTAAEFPPEIESSRDVVMVNGRPYNPDTEYAEDAKFIPFKWVTLKYSRPVLNGWHLVAVYDWEVTEDGNRTCYVSAVPGQMLLNDQREVEDGRCDHCNTNRRRNKSMLITKDFLEFQVVGSTCIKDFLGHATPNSFIDCYKFEQDLSGWGSESGCGGATIALYSVKTVLELAAYYVRNFGYVKAGEWDDTPTVERVRHFYQGGREQLSDIPNESDVNIAALTIDWIKEQSRSNDYMDTLHKCIEAGAISPKRFGIVVSAVSAYHKARERAEQQFLPVCNEHLGEVKERLRGLQADVQRVRFADGYYGTTTIVTLRTAKGHILTWFASGSLEVERNDSWTLDGTVKKHDDYNGTKQTVLTRVKYQLATL